MPDKKFTPPSDAVEVKQKVKFTPPSDALELKKKDLSDGTGQPSQEASSTRTDRSRSLSATERPQDQKASAGLGGGFRLPTEDDYTKMQEQGLVPIESEQSYVARAKKSKQPIYDLKGNKAEEVVKKPVKKTGEEIYDLSINESDEFQPKEIYIEEESELGYKRKNWESRLSNINGEDKLIEDSRLKAKYYESIPFNDNKYYSKRVKKIPEYDPLTQTYKQEPQEPYDGFIEKYYNTDDLKNLGVDLDDFDGFLERRGLKQLINTRVERGDFDISPGSFYKEASYEGIRSSQLTESDNKATSKQALIKRVLDQYIKEKELKNNEYKTAKKMVEERVYDPVSEALFDRPGIDKYVEKNLPNLNKRIQEKKKIDENDYNEILAKNGNVTDEASYMMKNIYRNVASGFGDRVAEMIATTSDILGANSKAEEWRDYKYLEELSRPTAKLAGIETNLKKVVYDNRNYGVDSKGNIYDIDAEVLVNQFLFPKTAEKIIEESKKSKETTSIVGVQGMVGDFARTMTDMAVQVGVQALVASATGGALNELLLAKNITALRNSGLSVLDIQKAKTVAEKLKDVNVITRTTLAEAGVAESEYIATQNVLSKLKDLSKAKASDLSTFYADFSKTTKIPITKDIGDAMIAQGAMGYSSGYEQTLKSAREAGISEDKAKELAETSAKLTSALYAVTTPIQPNIKIKEAIFGGGIRSSINSALNAYKTGGINGFKTRLISGLRVLHEEGKKELIQENVQQIGEIYGVNKYINDNADTKLAQEEYSFNDFINTSVLSYAAGGLLPGLSAGIQSTSKQNVLNLYNLGDKINEVDPILSEFVKSGKATQEQVDKLKREALSVHRNSTKIPSEVPYEKRVGISVLLEDINDLQEKKKNVDVSFHKSIDDEISKKRKEIQDIVSKPVQQFDLSVKPFEEQQQKPEGKNSLSLFQEISEMTSKSQMQEFSKNNPEVAFIHNNIEGIIKGIDGAKVVEC